MKIIKRNGAEEVFNVDKIIKAIGKANVVVDEKHQLSVLQISSIAEKVENICSEIPHAMNVEDIQDYVENGIMGYKAFEVARKYITYRYVHSLMRTRNTTDDKILSLIECNNEDVKQENSNKNPAVNSVQREIGRAHV